MLTVPLSVAVALNVTVAGAVALVGLALTLTVGAVLPAHGSTAFTVTVTAVEVVTQPLLSVAFAVTVYVPAATPVHE